MQTHNDFVLDLNSLLAEYLSKEQLEVYFERMKSTFLIEESNSALGADVINEFFNTKFSAERIRILTDTLITFTSKEISDDRFIEFILRFSKLVLQLGENNLSLELSNYVITLCDDKEENKYFKGNALLLVAEYDLKQSKYKEATNNIKKAIEIFEHQKSNEGLAQCEFLMGSMFVERGDLKAGKIRLDNCLKYVDQDKNTLLMAMVEVHFGIISYIQGDYESALDFYNKALIKFEELRDLRRKAEVLQNIGMIFRQKKELDKSLSTYDECIQIAKTYAYKPILNVSLINQAEIFFEQNNIEASFKAAYEAMNLSYQLNDKLSIADIHKLLGIISTKRENFQAAENYLLTSLRLNKDLEQELNAAETNYQLGLLYKNLGNKSQAFNHLLDAFKYFTKSNSKILSSEIELQLANLNA